MLNFNLRIWQMILTLPAAILSFLIFAYAVKPSYPIFNQSVKSFLFITASTIVISFLYRKFRVLGYAICLYFLFIGLYAVLPDRMDLFFWITSLCFFFIEIKFLVANISRKALLFLGFFSLYIVILILPFLSLQYSEPFNEGKLLRSGMHIDSLYHTAIAAMIKTHHLVSHGMHGTGELEYHFGSHILIAGSSRISGLSVFDTYSFIFPFLIIPLLLISIIAFSEELMPSETSFDFFNKCFILLLLIIGFGYFIPESLFYRFGNWPGFYESESFTFSIIFLIALLSVVHLEKLKSPTYVTGIILIALTVMAVLSKISTGVVALSFVGLWVMKDPSDRFNKRIYTKALFFLIASICLLYLRKKINPDLADGAFQPFSFLDTYVKFEGFFTLKLISFVFIHFLYSILAIYFFSLHFIYRKTIKSKMPLWYIVGFFFSLILGMYVILFLHVVGGSGVYVSYLPMVLTLPLLISIPVYLKGESGGYSDSILIKNYFIKIFIFICFIGSIHIISAYFQKSLTIGVKDLYVNLRDPNVETPLKVYITLLRQIREDSRTLHSVVYIPRSEKVYWESMICRSTGFFIPAISERPAIFAWPSNECYSFLCGSRFHSNGYCEKSQKEYSDQELLTEAHALGFTSVEVLTSNGIRKLQ